MPAAPASRIALALLAVALVGAGCDGAAGPADAQGAQGTQGTQDAGGAGTVSIDDPRFVELRNEAFRIYESGDSQAALAPLLAAHALVPDAFGVNERLGRVYADLQRNQEALESFERALAAKPDSLETVLALVTLQTKLGLTDQAQALLPALAADEHLRGEGLYLEAVVADQLGDRERALALVAQADGLPPEDAYRALSLHGRYLLERGERAAARERFAAAVAGRPDYKEALKGLADSCRLEGLADEAAHWDEVLDLVLGLTDNEFVRQQQLPQRQAVQSQTGQRSDYVRRELELRKQRLQRLTEIHPQWVEAFRRLAELQLADGEGEAACATIERFFVHHAALVPEGEVGRLRTRYCGGGGQ